MLKHVAKLTLVCAAPIVLASCEEKKPAPPAADAATSTSTSTSDAGSAAKTPAAPDPKLVARGDYLVNVVANCQACHTPKGPDFHNDDSKKFAGGFGMPEEFGTWRSLNITQDKKTGIGGWTDEQIAAAIREGKRPNGDQLFPIMPYPFYSVLSDDDVKAVVAYLRTIPPVDNAVAGNTDLKLPKPTLPKPTGAAPGASPKEQGAYLASLMHCGQCHTPLDEKTHGPNMEKPFAGGMKFVMPPFIGTGELYSANITPDKKTGIGTYSDDDILNALTKMKKKDGSPIMGPMTISGANWSKMEQGDLKNVLAWLRELKPIDNKVPKSTFKPKGPPPTPASSGMAPGGPGGGTPTK